MPAAISAAWRLPPRSSNAGVGARIHKQADQLADAVADLIQSPSATRILIGVGLESELARVAVGPGEQVVQHFPTGERFAGLQPRKSCAGRAADAGVGRRRGALLQLTRPVA